MKPLSPDEVYKKPNRTLDNDQIKFINEALLHSCANSNGGKLYVDCTPKVNLQQVRDAYEPLGWEVNLISRQNEVYLEFKRK